MAIAISTSIYAQSCPPFCSNLTITREKTLDSNYTVKISDHFSIDGAQYSYEVKGTGQTITLAFENTESALQQVILNEQQAVGYLNLVNASKDRDSIIKSYIKP